MLYTEQIISSQTPVQWPPSRTVIENIIGERPVGPLIVEGKSNLKGSATILAGTATQAHVTLELESVTF